MDIKIKDYKYYICIENFELPKLDDEGRMIENECFIVEKNSLWKRKEVDYTLTGADVKLVKDDKFIEITNESLMYYFEPIKANI